MFGIAGLTNRALNSMSQSQTPAPQAPGPWSATPTPMAAPSGYPAFENPYGLGAPTNLGQPQMPPPDQGAMPGAASNPNYMSQPVSVTVPDSSSRGFNPWSLTGESNARGK